MCELISFSQIFFLLRTSFYAAIQKYRFSLRVTQIFFKEHHFEKALLNQNYTPENFKHHLKKNGSLICARLESANLLGVPNNFWAKI